VTADQRVTQAREFLHGALKRTVDTLPPTILMRELAECRRHLGQVLVVIDGLHEDAGKLAEIRAVLAAFDWEFDDRQYALERIDEIASGGAR
jgi:hypothetical protein